MAKVVNKLLGTVKKPAPAPKKAAKATSTPSSSLDCNPKPYPQTAADRERERKWKAEDALRTLQRAEDVRKDKGLMKDAQKLAAEQMASLQKVAQGK